MKSETTRKTYYLKIEEANTEDGVYGYFGYKKIILPRKSEAKIEKGDIWKGSLLTMEEWNFAVFLPVAKIAAFEYSIVAGSAGLWYVRKTFAAEAGSLSFIQEELDFATWKEAAGSACDNWENVSRQTVMRAKDLFAPKECLEAVA